MDFTDWLEGPWRKVPGGGLRVASVEEAEARARAAAPLVPVTRLADLGPLDPARPHVFSATTPLARDLTTHLGKGATPAAARVSALMEAIERVSAEDTTLPAERGSFRDLTERGLPAVDPTRFVLPPGTVYGPDRPIRWLPARRLPDGRAALMAADLVLCPPADGVILQPDTNGLASGSTLAEAILHGLCEVIERDALGLDLFARLYGDDGDGPPSRRIATANLPDRLAAMIRRIAAAGHRISLFDHTADTGVPVIAAWLTDPRYPGPDGPRSRDFAGFGAAPSAELAALRALTEAQQSRLCILQGARDSFNATPAAGRLEVSSGDPIGLDELPSAPPGDSLAEDLAHVLRRLASAGFAEVYVSDLTDPRLDIPVARVRVAHLSSFLVDRSRVGPRDLSWLI